MEKPRTGKDAINHVLLGLALLAVVIVGVFRLEHSSENILVRENSVDTKVTVIGVLDSPQEKATTQQGIITLDDGENILIATGKYPPLAYGDRISVHGILKKPENFMTSQGNEFDYVSYLYKDDIAYIIRGATVTVISHDNGSPIIKYLGNFEDWFVDGYNRILVPKEADLMGGLTLGTKENIGNDFRNSLIATGTIHIIALSGYNVTIVANFLRGMLAKIPFLGATGSLIGGGIGIVFFVMMTGMQSSAIRAGIMALIALFGRGTGRTYDAVRALVVAGLLMIAWDPKFLVYDISFQLSFLATLGLIFLTPLFTELFTPRIPEQVFKIIPLRELMSTTLGAQVSVLPFILYKMGGLSLIALPANILVLPSVPIAMAIGTIAAIVGHISITLAMPFAFASHLLLRYIIELIDFFAQVPFGYIAIKGVSIVAALVMYGLIIFWVWKKREVYEK